jgi:transposase-like protein
MIKMYHSPEFKKYAVALYRAQPGKTITQIARELGISRSTLHRWVLEDSRENPEILAMPTKDDSFSSESLKAENAFLHAQIEQMKQECDLLGRTTVHFIRKAQRQT